MNQELKSRIDSAVMRVMGDWFSEQLSREIEEAICFGCYPHRMRSDVFDHLQALDRYHCTRYC